MFDEEKNSDCSSDEAPRTDTSRAPRIAEINSNTRSRVVTELPQRDGSKKTVAPPAAWDPKKPLEALPPEWQHAIKSAINAHFKHNPPLGDEDYADLLNALILRALQARAGRDGGFRGVRGKDDKRWLNVLDEKISVGGGKRKLRVRTSVNWDFKRWAYAAINSPTEASVAGSYLSEETGAAIFRERSARIADNERRRIRPNDDGKSTELLLLNQPLPNEGDDGEVSDDVDTVDARLAMLGVYTDDHEDEKAWRRALPGLLRDLWGRLNDKQRSTLRAMVLCQGDKSEAARMLKVTRPVVYKRWNEILALAAATSSQSFPRSDYARYVLAESERTPWRVLAIEIEACIRSKNESVSRVGGYTDLELKPEDEKEE